VIPNRADLNQELGHMAHRLRRSAERTLERRMQQLDVLARRLLHPGERIANQSRELGHLGSRLRGAWERSAGDRLWELRDAARALRSLRPDLSALALNQQSICGRLVSAFDRRSQSWAHLLKHLGTQVEQLNPEAVLARGYSIVETHNGVIVRDSAQVMSGADLNLRFSRGGATVRVTDKR
jgi:exodeoxyribonuclease VII large subunit